MLSNTLRTYRLRFTFVCVLGLLTILYYIPANNNIINRKFDSVRETLSNMSGPAGNVTCPQIVCPCQTSTQYDPRKYILGNPTPSFRDNLRPEVKYITAWIPGGFTNDVMGLSNLLYIAQQADRVPVLPPFAGFRDGWQAGFIPFGQVFDVPRLRQSLHMPILEWRDVKDMHRGKQISPDPLGCWSIWAPYDAARSPRGNSITDRSQLSLDLSYTPIMEPVKLLDASVVADPFVNLNKLIRLSYHDSYLEAIADHKPISYTNFPSVYPPDEHLMCFDFLYWASMFIPHEWETSYSPGWKIASHLRWTPKLTSVAQEYIMRLFDVSREEDIPPFITVHARHRDFANWCDVPLKDCFAPLEAFEVRVREIQDELRAKLGTHKQAQVIMTSDEQDPAWWDEVRQRGWFIVNHGPDGEDTATRHGLWYIPLLDAVIQSMGIGFVGTDRSTMSLLSLRRVEDWSHGVTRMVKWGFPGADNH